MKLTEVVDRMTWWLAALGAGLTLIGIVTVAYNIVYISSLDKIDNWSLTTYMEVTIALTMSMALLLAGVALIVLRLWAQRNMDK